MFFHVFSFLSNFIIILWKVVIHVCLIVTNVMIVRNAYIHQDFWMSSKEFIHVSNYSKDDLFKKCLKFELIFARNEQKLTWLGLITPMPSQDQNPIYGFREKKQQKNKWPWIVSLIDIYWYLFLKVLIIFYLWK